MKRLWQWFWKQVWLSSETLGIDLGRLGPWVLGQAVGASSMRKKVTGHE